jgi:hypothetical protein
MHLRQLQTYCTVRIDATQLTIAVHTAFSPLCNPHRACKLTPTGSRLTSPSPTRLKALLSALNVCPLGGGEPADINQEGRSADAAQEPGRWFVDDLGPATGLAFLRLPRQDECMLIRGWTGLCGCRHLVESRRLHIMHGCPEYAKQSIRGFHTTPHIMCSTDCTYCWLRVTLPEQLQYRGK